MPPIIDASVKPVYEGNTYTLQFKAVDPDGDPVTYSLWNAPEGLTISSSTGLVTWTIPAGFKGKGSYTVVAKDSHNGEATQLFTFDLGD